jgi:hypothetical protein
MRYTINKINVWQASKVFALVVGFIAGIFLLLGWFFIFLFSVLSGSIIEGFLAFFLSAIAVAVITFLQWIAFIIYFWAYNKVAKWVGGVEVSIEHKQEE